MASKWPRGNNRTKGQIRRWKGTEGSQAHCVSGVKYQIWRWQLWEEVYWSPKKGISSPIVTHLWSLPAIPMVPGWLLNHIPSGSLKPGTLYAHPGWWSRFGVALLWWTVFLCTCLNWLRFHQIWFLAPGWISQSLPGKSCWGLFGKSQDLSMWQFQWVLSKQWECWMLGRHAHQKCLATL